MQNAYNAFVIDNDDTKIYGNISLSNV